MRLCALALEERRDRSSLQLKDSLPLQSKSVLSYTKEVYYLILKTGQWSATQWSGQEFHLLTRSEAYHYVHYNSGAIYNWKDALRRRDYGNI